MTTWEKKSRPNVPEFSLPVSRRTPPASPAKQKKYHHKPRTAEQRAKDRRARQLRYVPHPRPDAADDPAEIESRIEAMRLLKERGMVLGREEPCNPRA